MLSDVEEGNNLMLTRLGPVATLHATLKRLVRPAILHSYFHYWFSFHGCHQVLKINL